MSPESPELIFQKHIADFFIREHGYGLLEQEEITDPEHVLAEDHLWAFLNDTKAEIITKLAEDYGSDAREEIFKALRDELKRTPLWMIIRHGLKVRGIDLKLYYPKPRSGQSVASPLYEKNRITFRPHFYFGTNRQEIDFVLFLNGLPIVAVELKHERNQTVHDAVAQFARRDHDHPIFSLPFLYVAADTTQAMVATDPRREENFRWFNTGLENKPLTDNEYPVEYLYREVFSRDRLLEALAAFLVYVPKRDASQEQPARPAYSLFPRYHQSRMVRRVADEALKHFVDHGTIGRKFLINHSAGSGKTLSICWLADRLHSLFKPDSSEKLVDMVVILTDRKSLDKNIRDDLENFGHLKDLVGIARKAEDLPRFMKQRTAIIVSTQQKFAWILETLEKDPSLKKLKVAFLIDEAHRSQEGQMGAAIRVPFRTTDEADVEDAQENGEAAEERIARIIREHDHNQLFVAFTATPAPVTVSLFGAPFDTYSESEAIAEGYIVDVASSIISYKTLYNLHCPIAKPDTVFPKGIISKALKNVAFQDDGLIQYKAEVMLRIFEERVSPLINGRAKAMIVATSRVAGLRYFEIIKEKLKERGATYKVLYAFSDFTHPQSNEAISEHKINELDNGELIEDRFERDDYRLMVVANKFQTGFDQPLLAGMFLDKAVVDRNAVQTVSRLNRCYEGKHDVVVVDFTNNAKSIMKAFAKYRTGTTVEPPEPDQEICVRLRNEILGYGVFLEDDIQKFIPVLEAGNDAQIQYTVSALRTQFLSAINDQEQRIAYVNLLAKYVSSYHFLTCFFTYPSEYRELAGFAEVVGPQLIKMAAVSEMMKLVRATTVVKASVKYEGEAFATGEQKAKKGGGRPGAGAPIVKVSIQDMIEEIQKKFAITEEEALYIKEVTEEKTADEAIKNTIQTHRNDKIFLEETYKEQLNRFIQDAYDGRGRYRELVDPKYIDPGAIFDIMAMTVIQSNLYANA